MSHVHQGPLATYNSLTDGHLSGYFSNTRMRKHLRKAGLVNRQGEIVSESTYRLAMSRKEHKKHVKEMLAQAIVHKTLDLERTRQSEIKKKLEEISKIQLVRRVRAGSARRGDEELLPYLTRSKRPGSSPAFKPQGQAIHSKFRPLSAPGVRTDSRQSQFSVEEDGDVLYLDDDGRPITPSHGEPQVAGEQGHIDTRHLHTLDTAALRKYAMLMSQMEEGRGVTSPYMIPQIPLPPKAPLSSRGMLSGSRRVHSASPKRPVTTDSRIARLHRPETAKAHSGDQQTMCCVTMKYHGWSLNLAREKIDPTQEVLVEQQHCGGNTLTVFKERLRPGAVFEFVSYRHRGYPFSLTLYMDGQMDSRVSTCCEFRHSRGAKIGGKHGHFSLLSVEGAVPCYKCQVSKGVMMRHTATPRKSKRPSERHMEEVIVVSTKKDSTDDVNSYEEQRMEKGRPVGDSNYDDDFEDDRSSVSSKSKSSSDSESDSETTTISHKDEARGNSPKERFRYVEDRGDEREATTPPPPPTAEKKEEERGQGEPRRSPRVEIRGTGREIDDYSSDEADEEKAKVISMEDVEAEDRPIPQRRGSLSPHSSSPTHSPSSQSSTARSYSQGEDQLDAAQPEADKAVVNVILVDKEEKEEEKARQQRERKEELKQREEREEMERHRMEKEQRREASKRREEERKQEELYEQQKQQEAGWRKEKQRKEEEDEQKRLADEELLKRRHSAQVHYSPEPKQEGGDLDSQQEDDQQSEEEDRLALKARRQSWKEQEGVLVGVEKKRYADREKDDQAVESSSRTEQSTSASFSSDLYSRSSSAASTPRQTEPLAEKEAAKEDRPALCIQSDQIAGETTPPRAPSPFPSAAIYVHRHEERELRSDKQPEKITGETTPPRAPSPFPSAATYIHRHEERELNSEKQQEKITGETTPPRAPSPFPSAATYIHRHEERELHSDKQPEEVIGETTPPRVPSPFPPAASYIHRHEERTAATHSDSPQPRPISPVPPLIMSARSEGDDSYRQQSQAEYSEDTTQSNATQSSASSARSTSSASQNSESTAREPQADPPSEEAPAQTHINDLNGSEAGVKKEAAGGDGGQDSILKEDKEN